MNKKIFLTSAAIMCMACPAIADTFPQDGNMLENKTYANAAVYDNTGIYEGTVVANADYSTNNYNVSAGSYFTGLDNSNNATTATCTSGNYCPGVASTTYENNAFVDDGLETCPNGYASSDLGASANTQCYRACNIDNMSTDLVQGTIANIAHAASLTGNDYYGNGTDTCEPATCVSGWHVKPAINNPDLMALIGTSEVGAYSAAVRNSGAFFERRNTGNIANNGISYYGLSTDDHNSFAVDYGNKGMLYGHGRCSSQQGYEDTVNNNNDTWNSPTSFASLTDETGQQTGSIYCYCRVEGYKPSGGVLQGVISPWVFFTAEAADSSGNYCAHSCADDCALRLLQDGIFLPFRAAMFGAVESTPAMCEANTINITWNDASAEDIAATGAATTVYEGDIKTPLKAITKPGKTFVGWKFVKPAATPVEP